jgi:hypothetical protein
VHLASGLVLLLLAGRRARVAAVAFGAIYAIVALVGLVDGNDVLGVIPVNGADNVLHVVLALAGVATGIASREPGDERPSEDDAAGAAPRGRRALSLDPAVPGRASAPGAEPGDDGGASR